jgi:dipeptidyl aminopeptidase/acylaminoacyl peptidase
MLSSPGVPSGSPRWSPESDRIVFDSPQQGNWDIYVVDVLGGAPRPLTVYEGDDSRPSWSQDGRWIYFGSDREGGPRIWKAPSDGGEAVPVTQGPVDLQPFESVDLQPFESPDGRFLYFSRQGQRSELWRVPVDGGKESFTGLEFPLSVGTAWDVTDSGIYFLVPRESPDLTRKWFLRLLRHDAPEPVDVMEVPTPAEAATLFDIARDEKWFVYAQGEQVGSDLMVLENFE